MKYAYIAHPYRGRSRLERRRNEVETISICREVMRWSYDTMPIAPQLLFTRFLCEDATSERAKGIAAGTKLLGQCDELWIFPYTEQGITEGMHTEIKEALIQDIVLCECSVKHSYRWWQRALICIGIVTEPYYTDLWHGMHHNARGTECK